MANKIQKYRDKYLSILKNSSGWLKNVNLSNLMTLMEIEFNIPALNDLEYNKSHPVVMALYKDVSNARYFDGY